MSDQQPETPPETAQEPVSAPSTDELVAQVAREVTLSWRALEEVDLRIGVIELELVLVIGLTLTLLALALRRRP